MTREETGAADVVLDLMAIQSNALEAIRDYGHYLRDAEVAGLPEVAYFVRLLMEEDSARAAHCQGLDLEDGLAAERALHERLGERDGQDG